MKANNKRKVFGDAVDLLMDEIEDRDVLRGIQMIQIKNIHPFHDHPFHLYEGERLEDMIASVKEHGILNPVIVQKIDGGYEMLSGHNRMNAAKLAGLKEVPAIVKTDLSEEEAYVYVIETNLMQRSFSDLLISEKAGDGSEDVIALLSLGYRVGAFRREYYPYGVKVENLLEGHVLRVHLTPYRIRSLYALLDLEFVTVFLKHVLNGVYELFDYLRLFLYVAVSLFGNASILVRLLVF